VKRSLGVAVCTVWPSFLCRSSEDLTAVLLKIQIFWDVILYQLKKSSSPRRVFLDRL